MYNKPLEVNHRASGFDELITWEKFYGSNDDDLSETVLKMCDLILERSSPEEKSQAEFDEIHPEVNSSNFSEEESPPLRLSLPSSVREYLDKVVREIVETEEIYVGDLRDVVEGYLHKWRSDSQFPLNDCIDSLFGNIESIFLFNECLLEQLKNCEYNPIKVALCFVSNNSGFSVYTDYCTNYPKTISLLTNLMGREETVKFFRERQEALEHTLPLGSFLLKPVQRILKYHLLLANIERKYPSGWEGHKEISEALNTMTKIAKHINEMKRRNEEEVRVQEIQSLLVGWEGEDLTTFGELRAEGTFRMHGARGFRHVFLFEKMVLITKTKEGGILEYKSHILCSNLMLIEKISGEPLCFHVLPFDNPKLQCTLQAQNQVQKNEWTLQLKKVILETYNAAIPSHVKKLVMELGKSKTDDEKAPSKTLPRKQSLEYLEKRNETRRKSDYNLRSVNRQCSFGSRNEMNYPSTSLKDKCFSENDNEVDEGLKNEVGPSGITFLKEQELQKCENKNNSKLIRLPYVSSTQTSNEMRCEKIRNLERNFKKLSFSEILGIEVRVKKNENCKVKACKNRDMNDRLLLSHQKNKIRDFEWDLESKETVRNFPELDNLKETFYTSHRNSSHELCKSDEDSSRDDLNFLPKKFTSKSNSLPSTALGNFNCNRVNDIKNEPLKFSSQKSISTFMFDDSSRYVTDNLNSSEGNSSQKSNYSSNNFINNYNFHPDYKIYKPTRLKSVLVTVQDKLCQARLDLMPNFDKISNRERKTVALVSKFGKNHCRAFRNELKRENCKKLSLSKDIVPMHRQGSASLGERLANFTQPQVSTPKKAALLLGIIPKTPSSPFSELLLIKEINSIREKTNDNRDAIYEKILEGVDYSFFGSEPQNRLRKLCFR